MNYKNLNPEDWFFGITKDEDTIIICLSSDGQSLDDQLCSEDLNQKTLNALTNAEIYSESSCMEAYWEAVDGSQPRDYIFNKMIAQGFKHSKDLDN